MSSFTLRTAVHGDIDGVLDLWRHAAENANRCRRRSGRTASRYRW
jgi:hypothetical protein